MLAPTEPRCAGFLGQGPERCTRRFECARFLDKTLPRSPFFLSACDNGGGFVHVATVGQDATEGNPYAASSDGVLSASSVRATRGAV